MYVKDGRIVNHLKNSQESLPLKVLTISKGATLGTNTEAFKGQSGLNYSKYKESACKQHEEQYQHCQFAIQRLQWKVLWEQSVPFSVDLHFSVCCIQNMDQIISNISTTLLCN